MTNLYYLTAALRAAMCAAIRRAKHLAIMIRAQLRLLIEECDPADLTRFRIGVALLKVTRDLLNRLLGRDGPGVESPGAVNSSDVACRGASVDQVTHGTDGKRTHLRIGGSMVKTLAHRARNHFHAEPILVCVANQISQHLVIARCNRLRCATHFTSESKLTA